MLYHNLHYVITSFPLHCIMLQCSIMLCHNVISIIIFLTYCYVPTPKHCLGTFRNLDGHQPEIETAILTSVCMQLYICIYECNVCTYVMRMYGYMYVCMQTGIHEYVSGNICIYVYMYNNVVILRLNSNLTANNVT